MSGRRRRLHDFFKVLNKINIVLRFLFFAPTLFQKISYIQSIDFRLCGKIAASLNCALFSYFTSLLYILLVANLTQTNRQVMFELIRNIL